MSKEESAFASQEIKDSLHSVAIEQYKRTTSCVVGLKVVSKKGSDKFRLITDLRRLNQRCVAPTFQYEDMKSIICHIKQNEHMVVADLKKAFHHTPSREQDRDYIGSCLKGRPTNGEAFPSGGRVVHTTKQVPCYYHMIVKTLRPTISYLRSRGPQ